MASLKEALSRREFAKRRRLVLYMRAQASSEWILARRLAAVLLLLASVIAIIWFDRQGYHDELDGHISFVDAVYLAMITITTVGYGDIVPVATHSRLIDALFITPVRFFIWFIFIGTAYQFLFQKVLENFRMNKLRERLQDHVIVCGFGESGRVAARETAEKVVSPENVVVIDASEQNVRDAADLGYIGLHGNPSHDVILRDAGLEKARAVIVALERDDSAVLVVLTVRNISPGVKIVSLAWANDNVKILRQAGADITVPPFQVGGFLLADAISQNFITDYVLDLLTASRKVALVERAPHPDELGRDMREIKQGVAVRIYREGTSIEFNEGENSRIREGDVLLVIEANPAGEKSE